ncbi:hypothetical protein PHLCEN_2v10653, partial [Hermanssonia centrifuga]
TVKKSPEDAAQRVLLQVDLDFLPDRDLSQRTEVDRAAPFDEEVGEAWKNPLQLSGHNGESIPTHGLRWRNFVQQLRALAWDDQPETELKLEWRKGLTSGRGTRHGTFPVILSSACLLDILPFCVEANLETLGHQAVDITVHAPAEYSQLDLTDLCGQLGVELCAQSDAGSVPVDLNYAIFFHWVAVNLSDGDRESRILALNDFTVSFQRRFQVSHEKLDLSEGLYLVLRALSLCDREHKLHIKLVDNLATWICRGIEQFGITDQLEQAIQWCRDNVLTHPPEHAGLLNLIGSIFTTRFNTLGERRDLEAVISLLRKAVENAEGETRIDAMCNLALHLRFRFSLFRVTEDLDEALQLCRQGLSMISEDSADVPRFLRCLSLISRDMDHLDEAIDTLREAEKLCVTGTQLHVEILQELSRYLVHRWQRLGLKTDVDEADRVHRKALELLPPGQEQDRAFLLLDAAKILSNRSEGTSRIDEVISLQQEALALLHENMFRHLGHAALAESLLLRFSARQDPKDAAEALKNITEAIKVTDTGNGLMHRAHHLAIIAEIYIEPNTPYHDFTTAYRYLQACLDDTHCDAQARLTFMSHALRRLAKSFGTAANPYTGFFNPELVDLHVKAVRLLPEIAYLGLDIKSRLQALRVFDGIVNDASVMCGSVNRNVEALEIIEEGRGIFWTQSLRLRTALYDLPESLSERLRNASRQLEAGSYGTEGVSATGDSRRIAELDVVHRRRIGEDFSALIEEVRAIPQYENFLKPAPLDLLAFAAEKGPVIVLVSHGFKCFAHCLFKLDGDGVDSNFKLLQVPLDQIKKESLERMSFMLTSANEQSRKARRSQEGESEMRDAGERGDRAGRISSASSQTPEKVLKTLWERVVKPIFDAMHLKPASGRDRPRLWWCPTGEFAFLPIHAAGDYTKTGQSCSDYVVSSYTPSLTVLINARRTFEPLVRNKVKALLAAVPRPFKGDSLQGVVSELQQIVDVVPSYCQLPLPTADDALHGPQAGATVKTILEKLPETSILHLASHGIQDDSSPLESGFIMRDGMLTISKLMPLPLPGAFLAFLSACETAKGDDEGSDQTIHLAATMLFAGFKSVVGTMWLMNDEDGPRVAKTVYEQLFAGEDELLDPDAVPYALDDATRKLREQGLSPSRWAQYIHLGM